MIMTIQKKQLKRIMSKKVINFLFIVEKKSNNIGENQKWTGL